MITPFKRRHKLIIWPVINPLLFQKGVHLMEKYATGRVDTVIVLVTFQISLMISCS